MSGKIDWNEYFSFQGRITRKTYILRVLSRWVVSIIIFVLFGVIANAVNYLSLPGGLGIQEIFNLVLFGVFIILFILYLVAALAQEVKRLHDFNRSGWWCLLRGIPWINVVYWLWLVLVAGTHDDNKYGPNPKKGSSDSSDSG